MTGSDLIVYATNWCGDCRRARKFLDEHHISYRWIDIDRDPEAEAMVRKLNRGYRSVPTLIFPDGSMLVEPCNPDLARHLGIEA